MYFFSSSTKDDWVTQSIFTLILAGVALLGIYNLPLSTTEVPLVETWEAPSVVLVEPDTPLRQTLKLPSGTWSELSVFAYSPEQIQTPIELSIYDKNGHLVRSGTSIRPEYLSDDRLVKITVPFKSLSVKNTSAFTIQLRPKESAVEIKTSLPDPDVYTAGTASINGRDTNSDIALSLTQRIPLPHAPKQGAMMGIVFILGILLLLRLPPQYQWWGAAILLVAATPLALLGYWYSPDVLGIADWDYYLSLHHYYREIILTHHAFPFWNPYTCGGTAGLGDPEFPGLTPTFALELLFDIPAGVRLAIFLSTATGALGMLTLAHRLKLSVLAGITAALAAFFGTVSLLEITEGHVNVFAAMWIPWIFWSWLAAYRMRPHTKAAKESIVDRIRTFNPFAPNHRWYVICGIFLALTFLQGGIYLLMYTCLAFLTLPFLVRNPKRAIQATLFSGVWALGIAAIKLIPVLAWLGQFPDDAYAGSTYTLPWLQDILFGRHIHGTYLIFNQASGWHEYGAYIGYIVGALALVGAFLARRNRLTRSLILAAILAIATSTLGPQLEPLFDQLWFFPRSNISRIILFAVIPIALLAAIGVDRIRNIFPKALVITIIGAVAIDLFSLSYPLSLQAFTLPEVYPTPPQSVLPLTHTPDRYDAAGSGSKTSRAFAAARAGYGVSPYCSVLGPEPRMLTIYDEKGGSFVTSRNSEATHEITSWSPNQTSVFIDTPQETTIALNTNFVEGWHVRGGKLTQVDGRVAARVAPGKHILTFAYKAPGFVVGAAISGVTTLLLLIYGANAWKNRG